MHQSLFSWQKFHERTKRHDRFYGSLINVPNNWYRYNAFDPLFRSFYAFFIGAKHAYFSHVIFLLNIDRRSCFALHFLNYFTTRSYNSADKFSINKHLYHSWSMRFHLAAMFSNAIVHGIQNVQATLP